MVKIGGTEYEYHGLTEDRRGIKVATGVIWTFPWFKASKLGGDAHEVDCLERYAPQRIKKVTFDLPDLTKEFPQTVQEAYERNQQYYRTVTFDEYVKRYPSAAVYTVEEFEYTRQQELAHSQDEFARTGKARNAVWREHGNDAIADEHGYRGDSGSQFGMNMHAALGQLGYPWEARGQALYAITYEVIYNVPDETRIYLRGIKEEYIPALVKAPEPQKSGTTGSEGGIPQPGFALRRGLGCWKLRFEGAESEIKNCRAMAFVDYLLKNPPAEPIHAVVLEANVAAHAESSGMITTVVDPESGESADVGRTAVVQQATGRLLDGRNTLLKNKISELRREIDDESLVQSERDAAHEELQELLAGAAAGRTADLAGQAADRVRKALKRLVDDLGTAELGPGIPNPVLQKFGRHIYTHILVPSGRYGRLSAKQVSAPGCFTYDPPPGVAWRT